MTTYIPASLREMVRQQLGEVAQVSDGKMHISPLSERNNLQRLGAGCYYQGSKD